MSRPVGEVFAAASCAGWLCVQDESGEREIVLDADEPVVAASVIKVLIALAAESAFADGRVDGSRPIRLLPEHRTPGPVGMSLFQDAVSVSARDLVSAMLTISDNVATDALLELVGVDACRDLAASLGLTATVIVGPLHEMIDSIAHEAGFADWRALTAWSESAPSPDEVHRVGRLVRDASALDPLRATRTTPREMCRLLRLIWSDEAGPPEACARVRGHMSRQLTRNRLAAGFPTSRVWAKSGGLVGLVRNEVGVIRRPDGRLYYAAVFTRAEEGAIDSEMNAAIGRAAALSVEALAG